MTEEQLATIRNDLADASTDPSTVSYDQLLQYAVDLFGAVISANNPERAPLAGAHGNTTPSNAIESLQRYVATANIIIAALNGKPFHWNSVEAEWHTFRAKMMGFTLVSKTRVTKLGYYVKRGAKPAGSMYFTAPIARQVPVYVLEAQCAKGRKPKEESEE